MRNEFEKQVREKMEELNFVPSDPVWEKIEEQIRAKKDRRKLILWIPLLALLLGGGTWWLNTTNEKPATGSLAVQPAENKIQNSKSNLVWNPKKINESAKSIPVPVNDPAKNSNQNQFNVKSRIDKKNLNAEVNFSITSTNKSGSQKQSTKNKYSEQPEIKTTVANPGPSFAKPMDSAKTDASELRFTPDEQKIWTEESPVPNPVRRNTISLENLILPGIEKFKPAEKLSDSRQLIVSTPAMIKYTHKKNWNFGASAAFGFSGVGKGLNVFNQEKSLQNSYFSNSVIPAVNNTGNPSPAEKGISFGFGLVAKKQLSRRLHLSTGLSYKYFSTKTLVGIRINSQRTASPNVGAALLDQNSNYYYISYGTSLQEYYNQYHIISLPFSMEMQLLKKLPLNVNAGLSINQLVKTNALQYNQANQVYYYDKNAFNRTQVFADFGLDYPVYNKKIALLLGPQFNYSVHAVNKNGKSQHLYAMQLRARLMLKIITAGQRSGNFGCQWCQTEDIRSSTLDSLIKTLTMKNFLITSAITVSIAGIFGLQGCMKDSYEKSYTYTYYEPVYKTSAQVRAGIKNNAPQPIEKPGKIFVKGQYIFLGEVDKGIHLIDNANPSQPRNIAFIDIPGNMDLTVKGNTLYADLYTDLVAIDISNPQQVAVKKIVDNIFPQRYYNGYFNQDSTKVIASWMKRDTTIKEKGKLDELIRNPRIFMMYGAFSLSGSKDAASVSPYGVGGSMARFTIVNDRLYTVGNSNLDVFNISNPENPVNSARRNIGWNIETIYPFKDKLFIGSTTGMFIYSINNPDNPSQLGQFSHVASCDPVIADDDYAYVTLRSGTTCRSPLNELNILKLNQLTDPTLIQTYAMSNPRGLSKDGNTLFVCDGKAGLKIYNASNVSNLQLLKTIGGMETNDVILLGDKAIVVATDGLYQYDYSDLTNVRLLSKITISN